MKKDIAEGPPPNKPPHPIATLLDMWLPIPKTRPIKKSAYSASFALQARCPIKTQYAMRRPSCFPLLFYPIF
jgi:hypothetical protein